MFTYSKYGNDILPDLIVQFYVFSTLFNECMVVLSDVQPLYTHAFESNEFVLNWVNFYLKSVNFLFLLSKCQCFINLFFIKMVIPMIKSRYM